MFWTLCSGDHHSNSFHLNRIWVVIIRVTILRSTTSSNIPWHSVRWQSAMGVRGPCARGVLFQKPRLNVFWASEFRHRISAGILCLCPMADLSLARGTHCAVGARVRVPPDDTAPNRGKQGPGDPRSLSSGEVWTRRSSGVFLDSSLWSDFSKINAGVTC